MRQEPWWLDLAWDALTEMASPDQCPGTTQSSSSLVFSFFGRSTIALQMLLVARLYTVCTTLFMPCVGILKSIAPLLHKDKSRTTTCAVLCCAVLCCAVLCCAVLCCAVLCCAVLCCAVLCCAVLCCAVLCQTLTQQHRLEQNSFCLIPLDICTAHAANVDSIAAQCVCKTPRGPGVATVHG